MFTSDFDLTRATDCIDGVDADLLENLAFSMHDRPVDGSDYKMIADSFARTNSELVGAARQSSGTGV